MKGKKQKQLKQPRVNPNKCNKKLLEYCLKQIDSGWINKKLREWNREKITNKKWIDATDKDYLYKEYRYARIMAGYLPRDIPECWRVKCVEECYADLLKQEKEGKKIEEEIVDKKKVKFNLKKVK